jgi:hypothetical protein
MTASGMFRHPHLTRGVVHTIADTFAIQRALVRMPDDVGTARGWQRVDADDDAKDTGVPSAPRHSSAVPSEL